MHKLKVHLPHGGTKINFPIIVNEIIHITQYQYIIPWRSERKKKKCEFLHPLIFILFYAHTPYLPVAHKEHYNKIIFFNAPHFLCTIITIQEYEAGWVKKN